MDINNVFDKPYLCNAFKESEVNEKGYSEPCAAIWSDYGFGKLKNGVLYMNSRSAACITSLYARYLDEKAIIYDAYHNRLMMFIPDDKAPKMAFKGGAWQKAVKLAPEVEDTLTLEQVYFELVKDLGHESPDEMIKM